MADKELTPEQAAELADKIAGPAPADADANEVAGLVAEVDVEEGDQEDEGS